MSADKLAELARESLEFLERLERSPHCAYEMVDQGLKADLIEALALREAEKQEPVAWGRKDQLQQAQRGGFLCAMYSGTEGRTDLVPLYLSPQQEPDRLDAERWRAIKPLFRVMSANIDGNHSWVLASSSWLKGGSMEQAADRIIDAAKEAK